MGDISKYFSLKEEWACKCGCGQAIVVRELLNLADMIREYFDKALIPHCVNRCEKHNKNVGGHERSAHIKGEAIDFHVRHVSMNELHQQLLIKYTYNEINDLGLYDWGAHVGIRPGKHFWDKRGK